MSEPGRRRDERGITASSTLAVLSAAAVALAGVAFVATAAPRHPGQRAEHPVAASTHASATPSSATPSSTTPHRSPAHAKAHPKQAHKAKPVRRGETYVEVFNNSGIRGLAGSTAARAQGAGWQVVGSDNWYGTIPASTVYYPARLRAQAVLLGKDLGIARLKPLIAPMQGDRLTVILTADYA
jgi:LytR cell envelope-related transcriptional attenuator